MLPINSRKDKRSSTVGSRLKAARLARGMSLGDVADEVGVSVATLSRVENEKQRLAVPMLFAVADAIGVAAVDIVHDRKGGDNDHRLQDMLAAARPREQARIFMSARRPRRGSKRAEVHARVGNLLGWIEIIRDELVSIRSELKKRR